MVWPDGYGDQKFVFPIIPSLSLEILDRQKRCPCVLVKDLNSKNSGRPPSVAGGRL